MYAVSATFVSWEAACLAVERLRALGVDRNQVTLLVPGTSACDAEGQIPLDDGEAPGMGAAVGSVVGGAVGLATASLVFPGVGPITVAGMLAAGIAGAAGGSALGDELEERLSTGLPRDELAVCTDALRRGRTVVIALADTGERADDLRDLFRESLAERIGPASAAFDHVVPRPRL